MLVSDLGVMFHPAVPKPVFALGDVLFTVSDAEPEFARDLARILPCAHTLEAGIQDVSATGQDVRLLLEAVLALHHGCRWIHGACVVSPAGRKVLIVGPSGAGKSTTALALALGYHWKVLADDVTLIDRQTNVVTGFAAPFSVKPGTLELLRESMGISADLPVLDEWLPIHDHHAEIECTGDFDLWMYFTRAGSGDVFTPTLCAPAAFTRLLLPFSSVLHDVGGPDVFAESIKTKPCYVVSGGSVSERVDLVLQLAGGAS